MCSRGSIALRDRPPRIVRPPIDDCIELSDNSAYDNHHFKQFEQFQTPFQSLVKTSWTQLNQQASWLTIDRHIPRPAYPDPLKPNQTDHHGIVSGREISGRQNNSEKSARRGPQRRDHDIVRLVP